MWSSCDKTISEMNKVFSYVSVSSKLGLQKTVCDLDFVCNGNNAIRIQLETFVLVVTQ